MFDRSDVLWRDDSAREPAQTPDREDRRADDRPRQVTRRPGAPGQPSRDGDPEPTDAYPNDPARAQLAAERRARANAAAGTAAPNDRPEDRHARDDGRTWTTGREWTDRDRVEQPARRTGHRHEHRARDPEPSRRTIADRKRDALADVGMYRAVSYTDLSDQHFDGHPYATRRAVNRMVRQGLVEEHDATGPQGHSFRVLTATETGRAEAHRAALDAGHQPEQHTWTGLVKPAELSHDTAVYRAALDERARIEAEGGRVVRVRLDAELKRLVARATETARAARGDRAADEAKAAAAQDVGLPLQDGHVLYPDAQLDIEDGDGVSGRVNVEIASDHYHAAAIVAKAGAGFAMHGSSPSAGHKIGRALGRAAARETDSGPGGGSGPGRDGSVEL